MQSYRSTSRPALIGLLLASCLFGAVCFNPSTARADPDSESKSELSEAPPSAAPLAPLSKRADQAWQALLEPLARNQIESAAEALKALKSLRIEYGLESFEEYSLFLIVSGLDDLRRGEPLGAKFRAQAALDLSPHSPRVLSGGAQLFRLTGVLGAFDHAIRLISACARDPLALTTIAVKAAYPILWAATLALYISFVFAVLSDFKAIRQFIQKLFPAEFQGPTILIGLMLILPLPFGILWSITIWGALLGALVPGRRWHTFAAGVLLVMWGSVVPIRENLAAWITDSGQALALRVQAGDFQIEADRLLTQLAAVRPNDGIAAVARSQVALYEGDVPTSTALLERAAAILPNSVGVKSMRGLLAGIAGDYPKAKTIMLEALEQAAPSPALLFNYSKIQFELFDHPASRDILTQARALNPKLVTEFEQRETLYPTSVLKGYAPVRIDWRAVLASGLGGLPSASAQADVVARLMINMRPFAIVGLGCALIVLFMLRSPPGRAALKSEATLVKPLNFIALIVPGAEAAVERKLSLSFGVLFAILLSLFPLIGWPNDSSELARAFPGFKPFYALLVAVAILGLAARNFYQRQR